MLPPALGGINLSFRRLFSAGRLAGSDARAGQRGRGRVRRRSGQSSSRSRPGAAPARPLPAPARLRESPWGPLLPSNQPLLQTKPQLHTAREDGNTTGALELPREPGDLGYVCHLLLNGIKMEFLTWVFPALVLLCTQQHRCIR